MSDDNLNVSEILSISLLIGIARTRSTFVVLYKLVVPTRLGTTYIDKSTRYV